MSDPTAAEAVVESFARHGIDRVFCVPGESYLAVLDALYDRPEIQVVACRHESGAGFAAVADAKLTGRPGVAMVSRGPGATNASIAVHTAEQDAVPFLLLVGQVERKDRGRGAFQEIDYRQFYGGIAKWVWEVVDPRQIPEVMARAFRVACGDTPGPVVVVLPEDVLVAPCDVPVPAPYPVARATLDEREVEAVAAALGRAERPLLVVGSGARGREAMDALRVCCEAWALPVALTFKNQDLLDNAHPNFAAHLGYGMPRTVLDAVSRADLVLAVGTRLGDVTTQNYVFPRAPEPAQPLIHVHRDPAQIGRVFRPERGVVAEAGAFLAALARRNAPPPPPGRAEWIANLHTLYARMARWQPVEAEDGIAFGALCAALDGAVGERCVVTLDGGNFSGWMHRYFRFAPERTLVSAAAGAMGLGVPGALAAGLRRPDRPVIAIVGDGGFLMTGNELATAVQYGASVKIFVSNNGSYGTIRLHQEKAFPGRVIATDLGNPDFAEMARAFGAHGLSVSRQDEVADAVDEALAREGAVVVDVRTSLSHISAYVTLDDLAAARRGSG